MEASPVQTLRLFCDVARCHSFSRAASMHGITQSAASQRVGTLEKRLGVTLLDRSMRPLGLTEAGRTYLAGCEDVIERLDRVERQVRGMKDEPEGVVRVAAIYSAGIDLLSNVRESFEQAYRKLEVQISYEHPSRVYQAVLEHECDLGILSYPQRWRQVEVIPLRDEVMVLVCRPDHALAARGGAAKDDAAARQAIHPSELIGYDMVTFEMDLPVGQRIRQYLRERQEESTANGDEPDGGRRGGGREADDGDAGPRVTNVFDNIDTIKSAVALTEQVSILPRRTVMREVAAGTLAVVDLDPPLYRPIGVIYRRRKRGGWGERGVQGVRSGGELPEGPRAFVDCLLDQAGPSVEALGKTEMDARTANV